MSNLSELLPSGGGQNQVEFVASGTLPNGKPVILKSNGQVEVVAETSITGGSLITARTPTVFESGNTGYASVAMLTSTKAIVTYSDEGNSGHGTACILDVSGSSITAGTPVVFDGPSDYGTVAMLTSTKAITVYRDSQNSQRGTACILDVSGNSITARTPVVFESGNTTFTSVAMLTSTKAIAVYRDDGNSGAGTACILSVSGSNITVGTSVTYDARSYYASVAMLTSTKAIVTYYDDGNSGYGTSNILDVSGTSITARTPVVFENATSSWTSVAALDATKAIVVYKDQGNSSYGTSRILTISGSTISAGTPTVFESASSSYTRVSKLTSTKVMVAYIDEGNSNHGTSLILDVSGTSITARTPIVFESASTYHIAATPLTSTKVIVTYRDGGNSNYGTSCILDNFGASSNLTSTNLIGIAAGAASSGATAKINTWGGINEAQTSLTIGSDYYAQTNGTITTATGGQKLGTAINATTINMRDLP